jgi:hypothetical protein
LQPPNGKPSYRNHTVHGLIEYRLRRYGRRITTWALIGTLACSMLAAGCEPSNFFRSNFGVNIVLPMGLGGTPGLLNPFGIVQAFVNTLLGTGSSGEEETEGGGTDSSAAAVPPTFLDPAIGVVVGRPGG